MSSFLPMNFLSPLTRTLLYFWPSWSLCFTFLTSIFDLPEPRCLTCYPHFWFACPLICLPPFLYLTDMMISNLTCMTATSVYDLHGLFIEPNWPPYLSCLTSIYELHNLFLWSACPLCLTCVSSIFDLHDLYIHYDLLDLYTYCDLSDHSIWPPPPYCCSLKSTTRWTPPTVIILWPYDLYLGPLLQPQEYDTLDSSNSGGKTSFDSAGSRSNVPEKRSRRHRLSRPKSLTNLVWDFRAGGGGGPTEPEPPAPPLHREAAEGEHYCRF